MPPAVDDIIKRIPGWKDAGDLQLEPLQGLTNTNYLVTARGKRFVLRVSGQNAARLGIDRHDEMESLAAASRAGIGPSVECYLLPEGHLVTRYINGRHLRLEEYRRPENIGRIVNTVKRLHELPGVGAAFSPFRRVESYARQARSMQVPFPEDFGGMLDKMKKIEQEQLRDPYPWQRFCHNDLFWVNVLDDGAIRFIDWELSGMGDIYYDLATLTYAYDSPDTLPRELQEYVLECYFGAVGKQQWARLEGMQYMVMFFSAMWALLQQGMQEQGCVRQVDGFSFLQYAGTTFEAMRRSR